MPAVWSARGARAFAVRPLGGRHTTGQQPEEVPMAALDRISYTAIAVMEFIVSQMGFEVDASGHAPVLQRHAATPYDTICRT